MASTSDWAPNPHVVELLVLRTQTGLDVPQTFAKRELGERHAQVLVHAGESLDLAIPAVPSHAALEYHRRQMPHELREDQFSRMHRPSSRRLFLNRQWHRSDLKSLTPRKTRFSLGPQGFTDV
jgi:hypothetical protein